MRLSGVIVMLIVAIMLVAGLTTFSLNLTREYGNEMQGNYTSSLYNLTDDINEMSNTSREMAEKIEEKGGGIGVVDSALTLTSQGIAAIGLLFTGVGVIFEFMTVGGTMIGIPGWAITGFIGIALAVVALIVLGALWKYKL